MRNARWSADIYVQVLLQCCIARCGHGLCNLAAPCVPHSPSLCLTLPHSASLSLTLPHSASLCLTLPHSASLSLTLPHSPSLSLTLTCHRHRGARQCRYRRPRSQQASHCRQGPCPCLASLQHHGHLTADHPRVPSGPYQHLRLLLLHWEPASMQRCEAAAVPQAPLQQWPPLPLLPAPLWLESCCLACCRRCHHLLCCRCLC
jgi:hypothetical protein